MQANPLFMTLDDFLHSKTPDAWIERALEHIDILLIDHAHCERKAALSALSLINSYPEQSDLLESLSPLVREEMLHFEKVLQLLRERNITFRHLKAPRYGSALLELITKDDPQKLIDKLIIGAIIEARSAERFLALVPHLKSELASFYQTLAKSESRHFLSYLTHATTLSKTDITPRVEMFLKREDDLIHEKESVFRFHSGV
jgi:tRNA-(ms[2]io[6]A)-hydroxylase